MLVGVERTIRHELIASSTIWCLPYCTRQQRYGNLHWLRNRNTSWPKQSPNTIRLDPISSSSSSSPTEEKLFLKKKEKASQFSDSLTTKQHQPAYHSQKPSAEQHCHYTMADRFKRTWCSHSHTSSYRILCPCLGGSGDCGDARRHSNGSPRGKLRGGEARRHETRDHGKEARWPLGKQETPLRWQRGTLPAGPLPAVGIRMGHMETGWVFRRRRQCSQSKSSEGNNFTARLDGDFLTC